jgi:hypothetical protein
MERQEVKSSQIKSIGYDSTNRQMDVEFKPGSVYRYDNIDQETFDAFLSAESKGKFFGATIKNNPAKYPFLKIKEPDRKPGGSLIMVNGNVEVSWDGAVALCKGCGGKIGWGFTKNGKRMPFDIVDNKSHFATCPNAASFKKAPEDKAAS